MRHPEQTDQELIQSYLGGSEKSLELLILRHKDRVFGYLYHMLRDEELANDLFQDTFMKVVRTMKLGQYNDEGKFLPWILRIAHNLAIDHFRKAKKMKTTSGGEDFDIFDIIKGTDPSVEDTLVEDQIKDDLRNLIELLPEDQRTVLKMRHFCDMSFKEIAEETNVSINTALGRMRYALINLRKLIEQKQVSLTM